VIEKLATQPVSCHKCHSPCNAPMQTTAKPVGAGWPRLCSRKITIYHMRMFQASGVAKGGHGCMPPRRRWKLAFVSGFWGFAPRLHRGSAPGPRGGIPSPDLLFCPPVANSRLRPCFRLSNAVVLDVCARARVSGKGVSPRVRLEYVEDGLSQRQVGELCDASAEHSVQFITLNPFTYTHRCITVSNFMYVLQRPKSFGNRRRRCELGVPTPQISPSRGRTRDPV